VGEIAKGTAGCPPMRDQLSWGMSLDKLRKPLYQVTDASFTLVVLEALALDFPGG
jgi:hypothetical protein